MAARRKTAAKKKPKLKRFPSGEALVLSASSLKRTIRCPGSLHAVAACRAEGSAGEAAERGHRIHKYVDLRLGKLLLELKVPHIGDNDGYYEKSLPSLSADEQDLGETLFEKVCGIIHNHFSHEGFAMRGFEAEKYVDVWASPEGYGSSHIGRGRYDLKLTLTREEADGTKRTKVVVIDYKTGWKVPTSAEESYQLHFYLSGVMQLAGADEGSGYIVSPYRTTHVDLTPDETDGFIKSILVPAWITSNTCRDVFVPSASGCRWCPALGSRHCPDTEGMHENIPQITAEAGLDDFGGPEGAGKLLRELSVIVNYRDRLQSLVREAIEEGVEIPGWGLGKSRTYKNIGDIPAAFRRLSSVLEADEFTAACAVSLTALAQAYHAKGYTGDDGKKLTLRQCRESVSQMLGDLIRESQSKPPLIQDEAHDDTL